MASPKKESRYSTLQGVEDLDMENDSDTTLASEGFLGKTVTKRPSRYSRNSKVQTTLTWIRWGSIVALQSVMIVLLLRNTSAPAKEGWTQADTETGGDINGLYVPCECVPILGKFMDTDKISVSHKYTLLTPEEDKFLPNMSSNDDRMAIRRNWDMLMPRKIPQTFGRLSVH